tara:strand:+ start:516 stop:1745 length:1230 start_codon:yes stop_codon:yes gene_type:complete
MHLIEQYALSCGVKIDRPTVRSSFFPLPFDDYIIIHPSSGMPAKNYDYFEDVIDTISPYLKENNIKIVQIGGKNDHPLSNCHHLQGKTSLPQTFYLINNCSLLLGNDSFSTHVASGYNKKIVSLYSNTPKECCGPYWGDAKKQKLLESPIKNKRSFSPTESPKSVNQICSWRISRSILKLLKIKYKDLNYDTLYTGDQYWNRSIEIIPNFYEPIEIEGFPDSVNIRLDYYESPKDTVHFTKNTIKWIQNRPSHLIFKDELDLSPFSPYFSKLAKISFLISESTSPQYLRHLKSLGKNLDIFCEDPDLIKSLQLKYLNYGITLGEQGDKKNLDFTSSLCDNDYYNSSKILLSENKVYSSKASLDLGIERNSLSPEKIIDSKVFWKEHKHFKIYKKNAKTKKNNSGESRRE